MSTVSSQSLNLCKTSTRKDLTVFLISNWSKTVHLSHLVPSRFPENIRGVALTTISMSFEWNPVLPGFLHGILTKYNLKVVETDNPGNEIVSMTLPPAERSYYVEGLKKYTNYTMWVTASNSKGEGPRLPEGHTYSTGEDGRSRFVYCPAYFIEGMNNVVVRKH